MVMVCVVSTFTDVRLRSIPKVIVLALSIDLGALSFSPTLMSLLGRSRLLAWFCLLRVAGFLPPRFREAADRAHHDARGLPARNHEEDRARRPADPAVRQLEEGPALPERRVQPARLPEGGGWLALRAIAAFLVLSVFVSLGRVLMEQQRCVDQ